MSIDNRDATASWSGYIFQGEVALCRAMEVINSLDEISDNYCLKLEEDEDFSIQTSNFEMFQVKAYESNDAGQFSQYSDTVRELICRYYYCVESSSPMPNPIKATLITSRSIGRSFSNFDKLESEYTPQFKDFIKIIHGEYTLNNIHSKLEEEIKKILNVNGHNTEEAHIKSVLNYCSFKIHYLIKKRHQDKVKQEILLKEIVEWVIKTPETLDEDIFWHTLIKKIFKYLYDDLNAYIQNDDLQNINIINNTIAELESLSIQETQKLLENHLIPYKKLDKKNLTCSLIDFIDIEGFRKVVLQAVKDIRVKPDYKKFSYITQDNEMKYQLTMHSADYNFNDASDHKLFQKDCEKISKKSLNTGSILFVTKHLNVTQEYVSKILKDQLSPIMETDKHNGDNQFNVNLYPQTEPNSNFGFIDITSTIAELNK